MLAITAKIKVVLYLGETVCELSLTFIWHLQEADQATFLSIVTVCDQYHSTASIWSYFPEHRASKPPTNLLSHKKAVRNKQQSKTTQLSNLVDSLNPKDLGMAKQ